MNPKTAQLLFVVGFVALVIVYLEGSKVDTGPSGGPLAIGEETLAPELVGITGYINAEEGLRIEDFRGKVVIIDFWTYTCINCIRTLPHLTAWDRKYRDKGLVIIGVHAPEFEFEKEYENVKDAVEKHDIEYRVVQDNDFATWRAYNNRYWPQKYLIDANGVIRYMHIGEGRYEQTEREIQELLMEIGEEGFEEGTTGIEDKTPSTQLTPELYAGYRYALQVRNIGNEQGLRPDEIEDYSLPESRKRDVPYLEGEWLSNPDDLESRDDERSSVVLDFTASSVNIVADSKEPLMLEVYIDGVYVSEEQAGDDVEFEGGKAFVLIDEPRLYNLIRGDYGSYTLKLSTGSTGFTFNAFTFG